MVTVRGCRVWKLYLFFVPNFECKILGLISKLCLLKPMYHMQYRLVNELEFERSSLDQCIATLIANSIYAEMRGTFA